MGSHNYAEVITDPIESREVVADFKRLCASTRTGRAQTYVDPGRVNQADLRSAPKNKTSISKCRSTHTDAIDANVPAHGSQSYARRVTA